MPSLSWRGAIASLVLVVACGCEARPTYSEPPASTYTTAVRQLKTGDVQTSVQGASVTSEFFHAAGVRPLLGRFLLDADQEARSPVVVLSYDLWADRFGSSPSLIGRPIDLDGRQTTVVGIAPRGFVFPAGTMLWTPK